jgi:hypothetical protein
VKKPFGKRKKRSYCHYSPHYSSVKIMQRTSQIQVTKPMRRAKKVITSGKRSNAENRQCQNNKDDNGRNAHRAREGREATTATMTTERR